MTDREDKACSGKNKNKRIEMSKIRDKMTMIIESELPIEDKCFDLSSEIL